MERITKFWRGQWIVDTSTGADNYTALSTLAAYEDTGLTAEEINDFKAWLNEDREDLNDITVFNDLSELMKYRKTGLTAEEIEAIQVAAMAQKLLDSVKDYRE